MTERTLKQIEENLRAKLAETADDEKYNMDYLGDIGRTSPHSGDPIIDPGIPSFGRGGGGKRSSYSVWQGPGGERMAIPRPLQKPRVELPSTSQRKAQELLKGQGFKQSPSDVRNANVGAKVWRKGEPESVSPSPQTPQEKLIAQAQAHTRATGEPTLAISNPRMAKILDRLFPEAPHADKGSTQTSKGKIEPYLKLSNEPEMRAAEPKSNMEKHIEYWNKSMPVDTISGKIVDKVMGIPPTKFDEAAEPSYTKEQYIGWAKKYAEKFNVPLPMVLHAMHKETGWLGDPERMRTAKSPTGARGIMQIQPEYAEKGAYKIKVKDLTDPEKNIEAGVRGLAYYFNKYKSPEKALAAYNAGEGGAAKFLQTGDVKTLRTKETKNYIKGYKDDIMHQLEKFFPKNKQKVAQVATDVLATVTGAGTAQAADEKPTGQGGPENSTEKSTTKTQVKSKGKSREEIPTNVVMDPRYQEWKQRNQELKRQNKPTITFSQYIASNSKSPGLSPEEEKRFKKGENLDKILKDRIRNAPGLIQKDIDRAKELEAQLKAELEKNQAELDKVKQGQTQPQTTTEPPAKLKTIKISAADAKKLPPVELFGHIFPGINLNQQGGIAGVGTKSYKLPDGTEITDKRVLDKIRSLQNLPDQPKTDTAPPKSTPAVKSSDSSIIKAPTYQPLFTLEKEKRDRELAKQKNLPMTPPSFDPDLDPQGWAEYNEYMEKLQTEKGDRYSREREAKLAADKSKVSAPIQSQPRPELSVTPKKIASTKAPADQKTQADWKELYKQNRAIIGRNPNLILPGQKLTLPDGTPYEVKSGDTLGKIAAKVKSQPSTDSLVDKSIQSFVSDIDTVAKDQFPAQTTTDKKPESDLDTDPIQDIIDKTKTDSDIPVFSHDEINAAKEMARKNLADIDKEVTAKSMNEDTLINNEINQILKLAGRLK